MYLFFAHTDDFRLPFDTDLPKKIEKKLVINALTRFVATD